MNIPNMFLASLSTVVDPRTQRERANFIGYLRSGQAFSMLGVFIASVCQNLGHYRNIDREHAVRKVPATYGIRISFLVVGESASLGE